MKGQNIAIERAPEPDDIVWENSKITMEGAIARKLVYNSLAILLLCVSGGAQFGISFAKKYVSQD